MSVYLAYATTATGVPITECEVCGQRHPVTRAHCSRCRSWSAFQRSGLCLICSEIVAAQRDSSGSEPYRISGNNADDNLRTLCNPCHQAEGRNAVLSH